jgi:hypothetical protein
MLSVLNVLNIVGKIVNDEHKDIVYTYSYRIVTRMRNVSLLRAVIAIVARRGGEIGACYWWLRTETGIVVVDNK